MYFNFNCPTEIFFGTGFFEKTSKLTQALGKKPMIVCGKTSMKKFRYLDRIKKIFKKDNRSVFIYDNISPDAKSNEINEALEIVKKKRIDFVIGLGGGSSIDAAKAISVGINFKSIEEIIGKNISDQLKCLPIVAIPTTAGTGSEVSKGSIIIDIKKKFKSGIRGNNLFPKIAIIDPLFSLTMPDHLLAETGFDAFTHLFESYLAKKSNPITENFSEIGLKIIMDYLPQSLKKKNEINIKEKICYAALLGGINVANASSCLPHRLQQAMGSVLQVSHPHARGLACLYPAWLEEEYKFSKTKIEKLKKNISCRSKKYNFILDFMKKLKVDNRLFDYGVKKEHIKIFLRNISGNIENDPIKKIDDKLIKNIYLKAI